MPYPQSLWSRLKVLHIMLTASFGAISEWVFNRQIRMGCHDCRCKGILRNSTICVLTGIVIVLTALAFNLLGDGLRDALDPRLKD